MSKKEHKESDEDKEPSQEKGHSEDHPEGYPGIQKLPAPDLKNSESVALFYRSQATSLREQYNGCQELLQRTMLSLKIATSTLTDAADKQQAKNPTNSSATAQLLELMVSLLGMEKEAASKIIEQALTTPSIANIEAVINACTNKLKLMSVINEIISYRDQFPSTNFPEVQFPKKMLENLHNILNQIPDLKQKFEKTAINDVTEKLLTSLATPLSPSRCSGIYAQFSQLIFIIFPQAPKLPQHNFFQQTLKNLFNDLSQYGISSEFSRVMIVELTEGINSSTPQKQEHHGKRALAILREACGDNKQQSLSCQQTLFNDPDLRLLFWGDLILPGLPKADAEYKPLVDQVQNIFAAIKKAYLAINPGNYGRQRLSKLENDLKPNCMACHHQFQHLIIVLINFLKSGSTMNESQLHSWSCSSTQLLNLLMQKFKFPFSLPQARQMADAQLFRVMSKHLHNNYLISKHDSLKLELIQTDLRKLHQSSSLVTIFPAQPMQDNQPRMYIKQLLCKINEPKIKQERYQQIKLIAWENQNGSSWTSCPPDRTNITYQVLLEIYSSLPAEHQTLSRDITQKVL